MRGVTVFVLAFAVLAVPLAYFFTDGSVTQIASMLLVGGAGVACLGAASQQTDTTGKFGLGVLGIGLLYATTLLL